MINYFKVFKHNSGKYISISNFQQLTPYDLIKGSYLIVYEKDDKKVGFAGEGIYDAIKTQKPALKPAIAFITRLYNKMVDAPSLEDQDFYKAVLNVFGDNVQVVDTHYKANLDFYLNKPVLKLFDNISK